MDLAAKEKFGMMEWWNAGKVGKKEYV